MKLRTTCLCLLLMFFYNVKAQNQKKEQPRDSSVYSFTIDSILGKKKIDLSTFKGRGLLIITTATLDTSFYQILELKKLYIQSKKLVAVLLVPTNDFQKEPARNDDVARFLERFKLPFIVTSKTIITGDRAHPLFKWINGQQLSRDRKATVKGSFQKFFVDENGMITNVLDASAKPSTNQDIKNLVKGKG